MLVEHTRLVGTSYKICGIKLFGNVDPWVSFAFFREVSLGIEKQKKKADTMTKCGRTTLHLFICCQCTYGYCILHIIYNLISLHFMCGRQQWALQLEHRKHPGRKSHRSPEYFCRLSMLTYPVVNKSTHTQQHRNVFCRNSKKKSTFSQRTYHTL